MNISVERAPRRAFAVLTTLALAVSMLALMPAAFAQQEPDVNRIAGPDRFGTAAEVALETYPDGADNVIIAAGFRFPDSLASAGLAGLADAPILLVNDVLDEATSATLNALDDLDPDTLWIAGGTAAVSAAIEAQLAAAGDWDIERFSGSDRFDTAAQMAEQFDSDDVDTVAVATGRVAADSLSVGPLAFHGGIPILLTEVNSLPDRTAEVLADLDPDTVLILGGTAAVSASVATQIGNAAGADVERLAGATRFETAIEIAEYANANFGDHFDLTEVSLATGFGPTAFALDGQPTPADALTSAPYGGVFGSPLLPINDVLNTVPDSICGFLEEHAATIDLLTIFGGTAAVSSSVENAAVDCATTDVEPGPVTLAATSAPAGGTVTGTVEDPGTIQSISVSGCGFTNESVSLGADGQFTLTIPAGQAPGPCQLTFNILHTDGTTTTQTIGFTVTAAAVATTAAPDLVSATVAGTVVTYNFDQNITGAAPVAGDFHIYNAAGVRNTANQVQLHANGTSVIANFAGSPAPADATVATIADGAVQDAAGRTSYASSTPLGAPAQPPGVTNRPDLQTVNNVRVVGGEIVADFRFDAQVRTQAGNNVDIDATNFVLVDSDGTEHFGAAGGVRTVSADFRTVTVAFVTAPANLPIGGVVRGGVYGDGTFGAVQVRADPAGRWNVYQTEPRTGAPAFDPGAVADRTDVPDIVSVAVAGTDTVAFTFDDAVNAAANAGNFFIYDATATVTTGTAATRSTVDTRVMNVTFPAGTVGVAVGAGVLPNAVTAVADGQPNALHETGLQAVGFTAGRTALPDLVSVTITVDAFGNNRAVYVFDSGLQAGDAAATNYGLIDAQGTLFRPAGAGTLSAGNTTVTFEGASGFTNAQAAAAVIGNVEDRANLVGQPNFTEGDVVVTR